MPRTERRGLMKANEKYEIKEALRKAKYMKSKEKGKNARLTNDEKWQVIDGKIALMRFMEGKC